jgi:ribosomal subunit interface protein
MNYIVSGKNIEVTEGLRNSVIKKLGRLEKFFKPTTVVNVTLSVEKNRQNVEVTIPFNGVILRAEETHQDMYTSIDKVVDVIERQIRRNKTRLSKSLRDGAFEEDNFLISDDISEETEFNIVRTKRFAFKPMSVEEAILQMNLLGHEFYVFTNADDMSVNVVYKRKNGDYGLIEPNN